MMNLEQQQPSQYLQLCPDLSALVEVAWKSTMKSDQLPLSPWLRSSEQAKSAIAIGEGASFLVVRRTVPAADLYSPPTKPQNGVTVTRQAPANTKAGYQIVYKIARVQFDDEGDPIPSRRLSYASVLLELIVLSHVPVMRHPNIIRFLGLAWADNGVLDACRIPVPILEHADFGNLADYQANNNLPPDKQRQLLYEVGSALEFLHKCQITHGDVKSENVLLTAGEKNGLIAKLSDFGFSILGRYGHFNFLPRGTLLWSAPEVREQTLKTLQAPLSDVYSFGLLCWRVALNGLDPLSVFFLTDQENQQPDLERLNPDDLGTLLKSDLLSGRADPSKWVPKHVNFLVSPSARKTVNVMDMLPTLSSYISVLKGEDSFWLQLFQATLLYDPAKRNLSAAVEMFRRHVMTPQVIPAPKSITTVDAYDVLQANTYTTSWYSMRQLPPSVCNHIFEQKSCKLEKGLDAGRQNMAQLALGLAGCSLSGMGSDRHLDAAKAIEYLGIAARNASYGAIAVVPRMCRTFNKQFSDITAELQKCAQWGSLAALEDLPATDMKAYKEAKSFLRNNMCGIGAQLFRYYNPPWLMVHAKSLEYVEDFIKKSEQKPEEIQVTPRGDFLLSTSASLGKLDIVIRLVEHYKVPVDQLNEQGESALHCAMRSGHTDIVTWLLEYGVNMATKAFYTQETPLHWLISVEPEDIEDVAARLLSTEESLLSMNVWAQPCDYAATLVPGYKDRWDHLTYGTPLHWAVCRKRLDIVRILLGFGADSSARGDKESNMPAINLAAYLHENEILEAMIDAQFPKPRWEYFDLGECNNIFNPKHEVMGGSIPYGLSHWIREAIRGCDGWKMVFRFGAKWKEKMDATFVILGYELQFAHLNQGVDEYLNTPLGYAARYGFHEAVEMILNHMNGAAIVNEPNDVAQWTPICWAIHRDNKRIFHSLLAHGADVHVHIGSPNRIAWRNWTTLHVAAQSVINHDHELCTFLLDAGVPVDGITDPVHSGSPQTALAVAIEENQFPLADLLRERGADIDAKCHYIDFQRRKLKYPLSILGCLIASNFRFAGPKFKYLLWPTGKRKELKQPSLVVNEDLGLTALHVAAIGAEVPTETEERDEELAGEYLGLLLERFEGEEELNARTDERIGSMTALHCAAKRGNVDMVRRLIDMDEIDMGIINGESETALEVARKVLEKEGNGKNDKKMLWGLKEVISLLEEPDS